MDSSSGDRLPFAEASRAVWALAWPAVALNALQTINGLLDSFFVGHLEPSALTAHGAGLNIIFLIFSLGMTISVASAALVARSYGAREEREVREANRQCLRLATGVGVLMALLAVVGAYVAVPFLVPASEPRAMVLLRDFLLMWAPSIFANTIITTLAGSMRGVGDTKSPMYVSGIQIALHVVLNIFFIFPSGPRVTYVPFLGEGTIWLPGAGLGLPGAALALSISAWISMAIYVVWAGRTPLGFNLPFGLPNREWVKRILNIAVPSAGQAILRVASFTVFTLLLTNSDRAADALGALRIGIAIESIMFMPAFGLSVAAAALVGQSLGAKDPRRAERLGWIAAHYGALVIGLLSIPIFVFAPEIAGALTGGNKPGIQAEAVMYIRWIIATEILFGYAMVLIGAIQGAGDAKKTVWITILSLWLVRVPLAWVLSGPLGMDATGCWIAMSLSQAVQGLLAIHAWRQGRWKTVKV